MKRLILALVILILLMGGWIGVFWPSCETKQQGNAKLIEELKEEARATPTSEFVKNLALHLELMRLDPTDVKNRKTMDYYLHKATEADQQSFENYKWGSGLDEVEKIVVSKGFDVINKEDKLEYVSKVFDEEVCVTFRFSSIMRKLYAVVLRWESANVTKSLVKTLSEKYGPPQREGVFKMSENTYYWLPSVVLKFGTSHTWLYYLSTKIKDTNIQEKTFENVERG